MGILEKFKQAVKKKKDKEKGKGSKKCIKHNSIENISKISSTDGEILWYEIPVTDTVSLKRYITAAKKPLEIIEDEIIVIHEGVVRLEKLLGQQNKKIASLEEEIKRMKVASLKKKAEDTEEKPQTLGDVLSPELTEGTETTTTEAPAEEKTETEPKPETETAPAPENTTETGGTEVSVDIQKVIEDLKSLESIENVEIKDVSYDPNTKEVTISLVGKPKTGGEEVVASFSLKEGTIKVAKSSDPTKWMSRYKYDPVTKMISPFPWSGEPEIAVEKEKKIEPTSELQKSYVEEKGVKPEGKLEIAVEKPKKTSSVEISKLAQSIVRKAISKNLIDPDMRDVLYYTLIKKADLEELQELDKIVDVLDGESAFIEPETGDVIDLSNIKDLVKEEIKEE